LGNFPNPQSGATTPKGAPRKEPRYTFAATTEIVDSSSTVRLSGRVSEISRKGCYVDSLNTLPVGTMLNLQILRDQGTFTTKGKIIYVHERFGMGVVFVDPPEDQLKILEVWLADLPPVVAR
jgi:hypothetical protein